MVCRRGLRQDDPGEALVVPRDVGYYSVEEGLYHSGMSGLDIDDRIFLESGHFWLASGDIAVGKNIYMHGEYAFAQDSDDGENTGDTWSISTYYRF